MKIPVLQKQVELMNTIIPGQPERFAFFCNIYMFDEEEKAAFL